MEPARLFKRILGYLINFILYVGMGFAFMAIITQFFELHILLFLLDLLMLFVVDRART